MPEAMPASRQPRPFRFRGQGAAAVGLWLITAVLLAGAAATAAAAYREASVPAGVGVVVILLGAALIGSMAWRTPRAVVLPGPAGLLVRFPLAIDSTIPWRDIEAAEVVRHPLWQGLGIRLWLDGTVILATLPGPALELTLNAPHPVTVLPGIAKARPRHLRLTVERPAELAGAVQSYLDSQRRP
jgi:hypothetical protein